MWFSKRGEPIAPRAGLGARRANKLQDILSRFWDIRPRAEDGFDTRFFKELIVLLRNNPTTNHNDIARIFLLKRLDQLGSKSLVPSGLA